MKFLVDAQLPLLKTPYCDRVKPVPPGWHPETVEITAVVQITKV